MKEIEVSIENLESILELSGSDYNVFDLSCYLKDYDNQKYTYIKYAYNDVPMDSRKISERKTSKGHKIYIKVGGKTYKNPPSEQGSSLPSKPNIDKARSIMYWMSKNNYDIINDKLNDLFDSTVELWAQSEIDNIKSQVGSAFDSKKRTTELLTDYQKKLNSLEELSRKVSNQYDLRGMNSGLSMLDLYDNPKERSIHFHSGHNSPIYSTRDDTERSKLMILAIKSKAVQHFGILSVLDTYRDNSNSREFNDITYYRLVRLIQHARLLGEITARDWIRGYGLNIRQYEKTPKGIDFEEAQWTEIYDLLQEIDIDQGVKKKLEEIINDNQ